MLLSSLVYLICHEVFDNNDVLLLLQHHLHLISLQHHDVATILDEDGVAIRAGHHCCQILHDKLNIPASSRASVGIYNTKDDIDKLNNAINNCKKIFNLK